MSIQSIKQKIKNKAIKDKVQVQEMYDYFFFDKFLERLSKSKHRDKFVLKGGFLLENIVGIKNRATMDIDFSYRQTNISEELLITNINEMLKINLDDEVFFELLDTNSIRDEEKYNGYRVRISASLGNVKKVFGIDIAMGDVITPQPDEIEYKSKITEETFIIKGYNIETVVAEKFQTIVSRNIYNTRMKDFYDINLLIKQPGFDQSVFHDAVVNTFENRKTDIRFNSVRMALDGIINSEMMMSTYQNYQSKTDYAKNVTYQDIMNSLEKVVSFIKYDDYQLMPCKLMIIRHGEDDPNKMGGWSDSDLTAVGIKQVEKLAKKLAEKNFKNSVVISSDLNRTRQTAEIIKSHVNLEIKYNHALREMNNGDFAFLTKKDFLDQYPTRYFSNFAYDEKYPNGESPKDFYRRVKNVLLDLIDTYRDKELVIITHGGVYGIIKSIICGVSWSNKQRYNIDYAASVEFHIE